MRKTQLITALLATLLAAPVFAQNAATSVQRDVNQQQRIENGLQSGQLTTREAARLEREESRVDHAEAKALRDGSMSAQEKRNISRLQNDASRDIAAQKHDAQTGNPDSPSSKRMQADVQRNINQQQRVENGIKDGSLTNHEAARMERGQARVNRREFQAGRDGHVGSVEQTRVQRTENRQSGRIHRQRHDAQHRG
ncbi:hypothetical protein [Herbaspirillum sp. ST 5-3]|uniref:hypothetical protein n=1 Tax=Oxalobacteraceae TaxID=75682 RepID=UPI0010A2F2A1|nr:hypothetical protein [Herbaspirillum sp. ST 5-3]